MLPAKIIELNRIYHPSYLTFFQSNDNEPYSIWNSMIFMPFY